MEDIRIGREQSAEVKVMASAGTPVKVASQNNKRVRLEVFCGTGGGTTYLSQNSSPDTSNAIAITSASSPYVLDVRLQGQAVWQTWYALTGDTALVVIEGILERE